MESVTITKVGINDKKKDGTPLVDKNGKHYFKAYIQTKEYPGIYINKSYCFENEVPVIKSWKEGDVVEVEIYEEEYNGKKYKNFKFPPKTVSRADFDSLKHELSTLRDVFGNLQDRVSALEGEKISKDIEPNELEPDDDIPF